MINTKKFFDALKNEDIHFFAGVPDSLLKSICAYITDHTSNKNHIIAANEGNALAIAIGYHLATNKIPLVYMQNSGLGNIINPLLSLADAKVYSIPSLLMIGWRGEPNIKDEPQHITQGALTIPLLETLNIPYTILSEETTDEQASTIIKKATAYAKKHQVAYALVLRKNTFENYTLQNNIEQQYSLTKEDAIRLITDSLEEEDIVVSTTGTASRELFEVRKNATSNKTKGHHRDFLTVGGMGHANQIALGIAIQKPERNIYCLDGDGALLMHMGSLAINADIQCPNLKHIILNNGCHDSVGGQRSVGQHINIRKLAQAVGYNQVLHASTEEEIKQCMQQLKTSKEITLLEISTKQGWRKDLGRPNKSPLENKTDFMNFITK